MIYTARFAHLAKPPEYITGDIIKRGQIIGTMGNTGASTAAHLHLDVVEGLQTYRYNLQALTSGHPKPAPKQATLFVDEELFRVKPAVTTYYSDPAYYNRFAKIHCGYDLVPEDRMITQEHFLIHWNRSMPGKVARILDDDPGYGHCIYISFEA